MSSHESVESGEVGFAPSSQVDDTYPDMARLHFQERAGGNTSDIQ